MWGAPQDHEESIPSPSQRVQTIVAIGALQLGKEIILTNGNQSRGHSCKGAGGGQPDPPSTSSANTNFPVLRSLGSVKFSGKHAGTWSGLQTPEKHPNWYS